MAKTDNDNDETPIEFEMPKWGLRGSRIPTPLNQPNWKYKYPQTNSKPDFLEKVFIAVIVIVEFFLLFQLFEFKNLQPRFYVFTAFWSLFTLISLLHFVNKESLSSQIDKGNNNHTPIKEAKREKTTKTQERFQVTAQMSSFILSGSG